MNKLKHWLSILLLAIVITITAGCANNPLGMSDAEWELLSPSEQLEARKIQDTRDEAARVRRAEQQAQEAAKQAQLVDLRRNGRFGDVVQCSITQAQANFVKDQWQPAQPISIAMHLSESERSVNLLSQDNANINTQLQMRFDGLNVQICRQNGRDCAVLAGTEAEFRRGISKQIRIHKTVEGTLFCSFPQRR